MISSTTLPVTWQSPLVVFGKMESEPKSKKKGEDFRVWVGLGIFLELIYNFLISTLWGFVFFQLNNFFPSLTSSTLQTM